MCNYNKLYISYLQTNDQHTYTKLYNLLYISLRHKCIECSIYDINLQNDLISDTFFEFIKYGHNFNPHLYSLNTYINTVLFHIIYKYSKTQKKYKFINIDKIKL